MLIFDNFADKAAAERFAGEVMNKLGLEAIVFMSQDEKEKPCGWTMTS